MNTVKFLEETKVLENKLRQKVGNESKGFGFSDLVKQLSRIGQIDEKTAANLKRLWELRNQIYSSPTSDNNISDETQTLLVSLIGNPKLQ